MLLSSTAIYDLRDARLVFLRIGVRRFVLSTFCEIVMQALDTHRQHARMRSSSIPSLVGGHALRLALQCMNRTS